MKKTKTPPNPVPARDLRWTHAIVTIMAVTMTRPPRLEPSAHKAAHAG